MEGRSVELETSAEQRLRDLLRVIVVGFAVMAVWNAALSGGSVLAYLDSRETDERFEELAANNRRNIEINEARNCVQSHERTNQIQEAIGIAPEAIVEVFGNSPDIDPAQFQALIDSVQRRVDEKIKTPKCDLDKAREDLKRLGE